MMPRDDGGGGMRDDGPAPPRGRGGMLTGLGATLTGELGTAAGATSEAFEALPSLSDGGPPRVLLFAVPRSEPTGADETLVATSGQLPRDFVPGPLWTLESGGRRLTSLPGFLLEEQVPLVGLKSSNAPLALMVIGRYPSPIEVS